MQLVREILERYILKNIAILDNEYYADDRLEIRINSKEKILIKKYAELKGKSASKLIRDLVIKDIDEFIKNN